MLRVLQGREKGKKSILYREYGSPEKLGVLSLVKADISVGTGNPENIQN